MEDVKRPSSYSEYPKKKVGPEDEALNTFSFLSLICGLVAVLFGVFCLPIIVISQSKIMGWASLFMGVASITTMGLVHVDKFNTLVTIGYDKESLIIVDLL